MIGGTNPDSPEGEKAGSDSSLDYSQFPSEPFPCPACGQMLAPSCRACVSCQQPIDPTQIRTPETSPEQREPEVSPQVERVRFPWRTFVIVLAAWFVAAHFVLRLLGVVKGQILLSGFVMISSAWVFYDAHEKRVPKPLRWGIGSLLIWIVVFPWYLVRRKTPEARCPFIEAEVSPVARALLLALLVFFLLSVALAIFKGPLAR